MGDEIKLEGQILKGKYRIESLLGQGGMGTVWAGVHEMTGRKLAIKVLASRFIDQSTVVERFGREARAASAVNHPGIVEVLDLDRTDDGTPFLVMERLNGETLADMLDRRERLPDAEIRSMVLQLLEALDAAHAHGVVHRDLKPENVIITRRRGGAETVKILDFGISAKEDERVSELTLEGSVLGTPHYMAPEQALGQAHIDGRADLYSLGVLIFECLTGDVPFDAPNYNRLIHIILNEAAPALPDAVVASDELTRLMEMFLSKDPAKRPQTARDAIAILNGEMPSALPAAAVAAVHGEFLDFPMEEEGASGDPIFSLKEPEPEAAIAGNPFDDDDGSSVMVGGLELDEDALAEASRPTHEPVLPAPPLGARQTPAPPERGSLVGGRPSAEDTAAAVEKVAAMEPPEKRKGRFLLPLLVLLVAMVGVAAWQGVLPGWSESAEAPAEESATKVAQREAPPQGEPRTEPQVEETITVRVRNLPAGARLYLDGLPTGSPPLRMRREDEEHELRVEAPGHDTRRIRIRPTRDLRVNGSLRAAGSRLH